jgi:hypothetical protein
MQKYIVEGDLDFYKTLNELESTSTDADTTSVCLITGLPLESKFVKLNCNHSFNYLPLFKDIYNSKFKINPLNSSASQYPSNKIKCPYCRNTQSTLLPYYQELGMPLIYGINTMNEMFTMVKNKHNKFVYNTSITYFPGICCFLNNNSINEPCLNNMVLLHCETQKTYCVNHINQIKKMYIKQIKDLKKQQLKEESILKKKQLKEEKKKKMLEENPVVLCNQILKLGVNKGNACKCKVYLLDKCKKHYKPL